MACMWVPSAIMGGYRGTLTKYDVYGLTGLPSVPYSADAGTEISRGPSADIYVVLAPFIMAKPEPFLPHLCCLLLATGWTVFWARAACCALFWAGCRVRAATHPTHPTQDNGSVAKTETETSSQRSCLPMVWVKANRHGSCWP